MRKSTIIPSTMLLIICLVAVASVWAAWSNTYDNATPAGDQVLTSGDDRIREVKSSIQERLNACMHFPLTGSQVSNTDAGKFRDITFTDESAAQVADGGASPLHTAAAGEGILDIKDSAASKRELWWWDEAGNNLQLTSGGVIYLTGEYDQELNLSDTGNTVNTDNLLCTDAGVLNLPDDTVTAAAGLLRYNTTDDTLEFGNDTPAWDALMSVATTAIANAAYGSSAHSTSGLSVDVEFNPDIVIAWNSADAAMGDFWLWNSITTTANKNMGSGALVESPDMRITVSGTSITFPYKAAADCPNRLNVTVYYLALNFRGGVKNPSAL